VIAIVLSTFEPHVVQHENFNTHKEATQSLPEYIEVFYNHRPPRWTLAIAVRKVQELRFLIDREPMFRGNTNP
jgi:hypothetical protein